MTIFWASMLLWIGIGLGTLTATLIQSWMDKRRWNQRLDNYESREQA